MASTSEGALLTDRHRREQVRLAITADSQARRVWDRTLDLDDLKGSQPIWKNAILDLIETWWRISADKAAAYLPRFREAETGDGAIDVAVARFDRKRIAGRIDWTGATNVLWHIARGDTREAAYAAARSLFLGVFHEAVLTGGRTTIENWAKKDPRAIGWRRVSDGDPCAFCAMLVTRGPVYTSRDKALHTTNPAPGIPAGTLHKYHPHCGCTVEIVYDDWQPTAQEQQWIDDYYRAAESLPDKTPRTAKTVLPILRRNGGFRDSKARRGTPEALAARRKAYAERKTREHAERRRQRSHKAVIEAAEQDHRGTSESGEPPITPAGAQSGSPSTWPHDPNENRILSMSNDLNVSDEEWARRQIAAGGPPLDSERMYPQEIVFLERAQKRGEIMEWIPTGKDGVPRNDFKWISRNGIPAELKSPAGTKYKNIAKRISDAVATAKEHGVTKNVFVVDFGDAKIPDKLIRQLSRYNENHANKITELWIWDSAGLRQLKL